MLECHGICIALHKIVTVGGVSTGSSQHTRTAMGAIQVLRNAVGGGGEGCQLSRKKRYEVFGSTLLALRGGGWGLNSQENSVT